LAALQQIIASCMIILYISSMLHGFASPSRFLWFMQRIAPFCGGMSIIAFAAGLWIGLANSPPDYQQGEAVRMMYVHVPAAWCALSIYSIMAISSFVFLVWRHAAADIVARQSSAIAWVMCAITLITGSLWGKPTWGTYWVWDARLTSMLVLLLLVSGYHILAAQAHYQEKRQQACALLCVLGALNLPIIKFSVEWWNTLHQPASVLRSGGNSIDPAMLTPLLLMALGFFCLYGWGLSLNVQTALIQAKLRARALRRK
jgi:heme exporter protein C